MTESLVISFLFSTMKLLVTIGIILMVFTFFLPVFGGAPYVPTPTKRVKKMLEMAELKPGETLIDIGAGDGRILIEAGKSGAQAIGYEIDPLLVYLTRRKIKKLGLEKRVRIFWRSFWKADLKSADVVTFYGITGIMGKMEKKLLSELKPGARVASYIFPFPKWQEEKKEDGIYLYRAPSKITKSSVRHNFL